jgi:hypothetical protein
MPETQGSSPDGFLVGWSAKDMYVLYHELASHAIADSAH